MVNHILNQNSNIVITIIQEISRKLSGVKARLAVYIYIYIYICPFRCSWPTLVFPILAILARADLLRCIFEDRAGAATSTFIAKYLLFTRLWGFHSLKPSAKTLFGFQDGFRDLRTRALMHEPMRISSWNRKSPAQWKLSVGSRSPLLSASLWEFAAWGHLTNLIWFQTGSNKFRIHQRK